MRQSLMMDLTRCYIMAGSSELW